jgi:hypothetical protein
MIQMSDSEWELLNKLTISSLEYSTMEKLAKLAHHCCSNKLKCVVNKKIPKWYKLEDGCWILCFNAAKILAKSLIWHYSSFQYHLVDDKRDDETTPFYLNRCTELIKELKSVQFREELLSEATPIFLCNSH